MTRWIWYRVLATAAGLSPCMPAQADPMFAAVFLNGSDTNVVVPFELSGVSLFAPWRELRRLGLQLTPPADAREDSAVDLSRIPGLHYRVDTAHQVVNLEAEPALLPDRTFTADGASLRAPDRAAWGAALDYAANVQGTAAWLGGQARLFGPQGVLSNSFVARSSSGGALRRLETQFVVDDYARARSLTLGDFVSEGLPGRRALRAGGFHLSTEPALRPDIFAQPLLQVSGEAALPSNVELLIDGVRRYHATVEPGRFSLRTLPTIDGRGDLSLVVTDALGRQTVTTQAFYSSNSLLQPGVKAFSLDLGALREDYAGADDHYGKPFTAFTLRQGISSVLTLEGHGELTARARTAGLGAVAALGQAGLVSAAVDVSDDAGGGARIRVAAQRRTSAYGVWASYEQSYGDFRELGLRKSSIIAGRDAQMGLMLRSDSWGEFSGGYIIRETRGNGFGLATASWSHNFGRAHLFASATWTEDRNAGGGLSFGLTTPLGGGGGIATIGGDTQRGGHVRAQADLPTHDQQGVGWRISGEQALANGAKRMDAEVRAISPIADLAVGVVADRHGAQLRAYGSGSVVWLGGRARLTRQGGGGLALIETGEPGVEVSVENRPVGRTGRDGSLVVTNLPTQAASHIEIIAESVPLAAEIETGDRFVRPPRGSAVLVRMPVRRRANAQLQVRQASGRPLPVGATVRLNGSPAGLVGFDSWIYLKGVRPENVIEIEHDGGLCRLWLALEAPPSGPLPPQPCAAARDGGDLRRVNADGPDPRHGSEKLLGLDDPSSLWRLQGDRPPRQNGAGRRALAMQLYLARLRSVLVQPGRPVRWLGFGQRPPDDPHRRDGHIEIPAV